MIYVTGDTHGEMRRFRRDIFLEQAEMTKDDYVIILGDFGAVWYSPDDNVHQKIEHYILDELDGRPFTTLFIPGNHENYDRLMGDEFEEVSWHGGRVKMIRPSVMMLMRGNMYEIDGAKFFAFGGASSHDVFDGILDGDDPDWRKKAKRLEKQGKGFYRVKGVSWWQQELPTKEEMAHGIETLDRNGWAADFVLTHCAPSSVQAMLGFHDTDCLTKYLEDVKAKLQYKHWFFGHYHMNRVVSASDMVLYEQIVRIR